MKLFRINHKLQSKFFNTGTAVLSAVFNPMNRVVVHYSGSKRTPIFAFIMKVKNECDMLLWPNEAYQIYMAVENTKKIPGDIAEVGVYKGGSARIICQVKGKKDLHLFDTYEGLPDVENVDVLFEKGEFVGTLEQVKKYLKKYPKVHYYKGIFPKTSAPIKNKKFSFVHLDVDIYSSTLDSLKFFYPRMNKGGIIISHDYINAAGVMQAFDEFFEDKPEPIIEMSGSQALIVKV